jgi:hypothetical protein
MKPSPSRRAALGMCLVAVVVVAGCGGAQVTSPANSEPSICNEIPSTFGGCDPDRPVFAGSTCQGLAAEWGRDVDKRIVGVIRGPADEDGNAKSARNVDALVLSSMVVRMRLDELGIRPSCGLDRFWPIAEQQFSADLRSGAGAILWDGNPVVTFNDWAARAKDIVGMIEKDLSPAPSE